MASPHTRLTTAELPRDARPTPSVRPEVPDFVPAEHAAVGSVEMQIRTLRWERDEALRKVATLEDYVARLRALETAVTKALFLSSPLPSPEHWEAIVTAAIELANREDSAK